MPFLNLQKPQGLNMSEDALRAGYVHHRPHSSLGKPTDQPHDEVANDNDGYRGSW